MRKNLLFSFFVMLFAMVASTVNAEVGKKYITVFSQDFENENTYGENWTSDASDVTRLEHGEANHFLAVKGIGNPNYATFSFEAVPEVNKLTDYEFSFVYGLCPSGASQGAEKNVFYYRTRNGEEIDTLFSVYSYRPSSSSATVNAEIRKHDGTVIATIPIGKRYLAFPDYLYRFTVKSSESGVVVSLYSITQDKDILVEEKFADKALVTDGFVLDNSNSGITYSSLQVFDDLTLKVPTDDDVAEKPTIFISQVIGVGRMISATAKPHEELHYAITATESLEGAEWDILAGESEYEIDQVEENCYVWAYTTYGSAISDTVMLYVECGDIQLNPVEITRKADNNNNITLTANQKNLLCSPVSTINYTINGGEVQVAENKESITITITEDSEIEAWATDLDGCYLDSEKSKASFTLFVPEEYKPTEFTVYHWESNEGNVTEYGGVVEYENGDGSNRLNVSTGGYYNMTINGKKGNIDDAASANAGHMTITLKDGFAFKSGDIITMTAFKNNGDASKLSTPYFRTLPSSTSWYDDSINWGDIKIEGQQPTTETFIVPEGAEGDTKLQISRSKAGTNFFITVLDIAHADPTGINEIQKVGSINVNVYDVMGRKVTSVIPGNLYIQNNKKFIAK